MKENLFLHYKKNNDMNKISYALGMNLAQSLMSSGVETLNFESFTKGLQNAFEGTNTEFSPEEAHQILQEYFTGGFLKTVYIFFGVSVHVILFPRIMN